MEVEEQEREVVGWTERSVQRSEGKRRRRRLSSEFEEANGGLSRACLGGRVENSCLMEVRVENSQLLCRGN